MNKENNFFAAQFINFHNMGFTIQNKSIILLTNVSLKKVVYPRATLVLFWGGAGAQWSSEPQKVKQFRFGSFKWMRNLSFF